jgi:hypothetical protein
LILELKHRQEDAVKDWDYTVDIEKPPIHPPSRIMRETWGLDLYETRKSKRRRADYSRYLEEYGKAFEANDKPA